MPKIEYEGDKNRILSTKGVGEKMADIMARRYSRRAALASGAAAGAAVTLGIKTSAQSPEASPVGTHVATPGASPVAENPTLSFDGLSLQQNEDVVVSKGYTAVPFLRWGDPLFPDSPEFDLANQTAESQAMQIGYNCDYIGWISLPMGSNSSDHGLLLVNHEYTNPELMFPGYLSANPDFNALPTPDSSVPEVPEFLINTSQSLVDVELETHGLSVVEVMRTDGQWDVILDSEYNRRITATTPTLLTGPVAASELVMTSEDPTGTEVIGMLNNCAGGTTPWGTVISGEENFNQ